MITANVFEEGLVKELFRKINNENMTPLEKYEMLKKRREQLIKARKTDNKQYGPIGAGIIDLFNGGFTRYNDNKIRQMEQSPGILNSIRGIR